MTLLVVWAITVEMRVFFYKKKIQTLIEIIKKQTEMLRETNTKSEKNSLKIKTVFRAIEGNSDNILEIVKALNQLSYEVSQSEILEYKDKPTIQ